VKLRVWVSDEAKQQADDIDAWWQVERTAGPDTFWREFTNALERLHHPPTPGVSVRRAGVRGLRRVLLPKSRVHIYFVFDEDEHAIRIWAIWSAIRRRGPPLPKAARTS
jgi:hypothetical protein